MASISYKNNENNVIITGVLAPDSVEEVISLPFIASGYTIHVTPTGGACSVWVSNDNTNWIIWDEGSVSATAIGAFIPTQYIKITNTTSTSTAYAIWGF